MSIDRLLRHIGGNRAAQVWGLASLVAAAAISLAWAHSDPRMFGLATQVGPKSPSGPVTVTLPAGAEAAALFEVGQARGGVQGTRLKTYGQVVPDAGAVLDVNTAVSGQVAQVFVRPGDRVRKGDALIAIFNPEFITTQKGYLEFLKNEEKLQVLREEGRLPNYLKDAKENLRWWGMSEAEVTELIDHGRVVHQIVLHAPSDGFVTDMFVKPGSLVNPGDRTMKQFVVVGKAVARMVVADTAYWLEGYVFPDQRALLHPGLRVTVSLPGGGSLERAVTEVSPMIDPQTQRARFLIKLGRNIPGLAIGQSCELTLLLAGSQGTWVPRQAVLGQGIDPVVYVPAGKGRYQRRQVAVLGESEGWLQVQGVRAGEPVLVAGKMMLEGYYRISAGADAKPGGADSHDDHHH